MYYRCYFILQDDMDKELSRARQKWIPILKLNIIRWIAQLDQYLSKELQQTNR